MDSTKTAIIDADQMPTKISDHIDVTLASDNILLLCHQKQVQLWNISTGIHLFSFFIIFCLFSFILIPERNEFDLQFSRKMYFFRPIR